MMIGQVLIHSKQTKQIFFFYWCFFFIGGNSLGFPINRGSCSVELALLSFCALSQCVNCNEVASSSDQTANTAASLQTS